MWFKVNGANTLNEDRRLLCGNSDAAQYNTQLSLQHVQSHSFGFTSVIRSRMQYGTNGEIRLESRSNAIVAPDSWTHAAFTLSVLIIFLFVSFRVFYRRKITDSKLI
jgi:hypothetical protein